jgi:hypothetical protein
MDPAPCNGGVIGADLGTPIIHSAALCCREKTRGKTSFPVFWSIVYAPFRRKCRNSEA